MITDEKRAFKRAPCKFVIEYRAHGPETSGQSGVSVTENISLGGVYFLSLEDYAIGQLLDCQVSIPGAKTKSRWTARVVRCENIREKMVRTFGVAAEFVRSHGDSDKELEKALHGSHG